MFLSGLMIKFYWGKIGLSCNKNGGSIGERYAQLILISIK